MERMTVVAMKISAGVLLLLSRRKYFQGDSPTVIRCAQPLA
jgi:hypothetical protein